MKDYQAKMIELAQEIEKHGHGELTVRFEVLKTPLKTKIVVLSGRSYVYFEKRENKFDEELML